MGAHDSHASTACQKEFHSFHTELFDLPLDLAVTGFRVKTSGCKRQSQAGFSL
jgi:hypothetical protein